MKLLKRILITLLTIVVLAIASIWMIAKYQQDKLVAIAVEKLNASWPMRIEMEKAEVDIFSQFPKISVTLDSVRLYPSKTATDNIQLLSCKNFYLSTHLLKALRGEFDISSITISEGTLRWNDQLKQQLFSSSEKTAQDSTQSPIALELIRLQEIHLMVDLSEAKLSLDTQIDDLRLTGELSSEEFDAKFESDLWVESMIYDQINYFQKIPVYLASDLFILFKEPGITFHSGTLIKSKSQINWKGKVTCPSFCDLNLTFKGEQVSLAEITQRMGDLLGGQWKSYNGKGDVVIDGSIIGQTDGRLAIVTSFSVQDGTLSHSQGYALHQLSATGKYDGTTNHPSVDISAFSAQLKNSSFKGAIGIKNFERPILDISIDANGNAEDILPLFNDSATISAKGPLQMAVQFKGQLDKDASFTKATYKQAKVSGEMTLNDVTMQIAEFHLPLEHMKGTINFSNNDLNLKDFFVQMGLSDLAFTGSVQDGISYFMTPDTKMAFKGDIVSRNLTVDELLVETEDESGAAAGLVFPQRISFNGTFKADELSWRRFYASNVSSKFQLNHNGLWIDQFAANTMNGQIELKAKITERKNDDWLNLAANWDLKGVAIDQFLYDLEGLGQDYLLPEQIKGKAWATGKLEGQISKQLEWNLNAVDAESSIKVTGGSLIAHPSVIELAEYLSENKLVKRVVDTEALKKKAQKIDFETLENDIKVKHQTVYIPNMHIGSSAIDIDVSGTHQFNDSIDYNMSFLLSDVWRISNEDVDEVEVKKGSEKPIRMYIHMTGTTSDPIIELDRKNVRKALKQELKTEKQSIKVVLKSEIGLFKNDTSIKAPEPKNDDPAYEVEWEDNAGDQDQKPENPTTEEEKQPTFKLFRDEPRQDKPVEEANPEDWDDDF